MIAALYIDPRGPYPRMAAGAEWDGSSWSYEGKAGNGPRLALDCWDATRDARLYAGPHPVVAHPPCGPYSKQRHNYGGSEHDCAPRAVEQVRAYGGVLEHPAGSKLWEACGLPKPIPWDGDRSSWPDVHGGYTVEVAQVEWGHVARKPTWLYLVGVPRDALEPPPFPDRQPTHWCSGNRKNKNGGSVPPGIKICSAQQRRRTPPLVAEYLVRLARAAGQERSRYLAEKRAVEGRR